jgi:hypothetical protein
MILVKTLFAFIQCINKDQQLSFQGDNACFARLAIFFQPVEIAFRWGCDGLLTSTTDVKYCAVRI